MTSGYDIGRRPIDGLGHIDPELVLCGAISPGKLGRN
jgi:hypothetical protein